MFARKNARAALGVIIHSGAASLVHSIPVRALRCHARAFTCARYLRFSSIQVRRARTKSCSTFTCSSQVGAVGPP